MKIQSVKLQAITVTLEDGVLTVSGSGDIQSAAFKGRGDITSVIIEDGITSVKSNSFRQCGALKSVLIGNSVSYIGDSAFYGCGSLNLVTIGNSVTSIGSSAFYGCGALNSVTMGKLVNSIQDNAFDRCNFLASINFLGTSASGISFGEYAISESGKSVGGLKVYVFTSFSGTKFGGINVKKCLYNIKYNLGGENVKNLNPLVYNSDEGTTVNKSPTREGYKFTGWTGSNGDNPQTVVMISTGFTGDKTYTAHWSQLYSITYVGVEGATFATANPTGYITEEEIILNNPTKTGYKFTGWTVTGTGEITTGIPKSSTGAKSFTANWTPIEYKINYILNEGTLAEGSPINYTIESPDVALIAPSRRGYDFNGWTVTETGETVTVIPKNSTEDKSFTANWKPTEYKINYDLKGGALAEGKSNPVSYNIEKDTITLNNPTREGYKFIGWTGSNGETPQTEVIIPKGTTENKNYEANWEREPTVAEKKSELSGGAITGIAVSVIVVVTIMALGIILWIKKRRDDREQEALI